jgi:hypothetical protein
LLAKSLLTKSGAGVDLQQYVTKRVRPMLCSISICGGLLIMIGHHACSEALFYYFGLGDQVPEHNRLLKSVLSNCSSMA